MKITCSILCYNYGRYLAQAIESCLNQQPGDYELEVLVIDDGSTDETPAVCQQYADRVRVLRSDNLGFGASLDRAIQAATGDYVCLLDADDYFAPDKLVTVLPAMVQGYLYIDHAKYFIDEVGDRLKPEPQAGWNTSTICLNRAAALTLLPVQNEVFFHPLRLAGRGIQLSQPLSYYRIHSSSMVNSKPPSVWLSHLARVTHQLADRLAEMSHRGNCAWATPAQLRKIGWEYRVAAYYDEMEAALARQEQALARQMGWKLLQAIPYSLTGWSLWHGKVLWRGLITGRAISYDRQEAGCQN